MRDNIFNKNSDLVDFCFNNEVVAVFDDMVMRSVPGYKNILEFIQLSAKIYTQNNSNLYDLGCSTGATSLALNTTKNAKIIAIDNSAVMLKKCQKNLQHLPNIEFILSNISDIKIINASMVVLNLTLQFIDKNQRDGLINKIYQGLNFGGVLIISEKVHFKNKKTNDFFTKLHQEFKKANGYSKLEIAKKRQLLEDILITDNEKIHLQRFKNAGFLNYQKVLQNINFQTFIAVKY